MLLPEFKLISKWFRLLPPIIFPLLFLLSIILIFSSPQPVYSLPSLSIDDKKPFVPPLIGEVIVGFRESYYNEDEEEYISILESNVDEAFELYMSGQLKESFELAERTVEEINHHEGILPERLIMVKCRILSSVKVGIYMHWGEMGLALECGRSAIELAETTSSNEILPITLNNIAYISRFTGDIEAGVAYHLHRGTQTDIVKCFCYDHNFQPQESKR